MQTRVVKKPKRCVFKDAKKREMDRLVKIMEMKNNLPVLTKEQIRRYRLPIHEALIQGLIEEGYINSAEFFRQLIDLQIDFREKNSHDLTLMTRPELIKSNEIMSKLCHYFKKAEDEHLKGNLLLEVDMFLHLCYDFYELSDWIWLVEQLFLQCFFLCQNIYDNNFRMTCWRVLYGKFLTEIKNNYDIGLYILEEARIDSLDKSWTLQHITGKRPKLIVEEVSKIIYKCLLDHFDELVKDNPQRALELCRIAKDKGVEGCLPLADINYMEGKLELKAQNSHRAITCFTTAFHLYKNLELHDKACEAKFGLAYSYLYTRNWAKCLEQNLFVLHYAEAHNLPQYVGKAYLYIGRYNLNKGHPEKATYSLEKAYEIFHLIDDLKHKDFVEDLVAISKGQELLPKLVNLITKAEEGNRECLLQFLDWKLTRTPFWTDDSPATLSLETSNEALSFCKEEEQEESTTDEIFGLVASEEEKDLPNDNENAD